jgi:hypothetical protein
MDILRRVIHFGALNQIILSIIAKPKRERFKWYIDGERCKNYMTESRWGRLLSHPLINDPQFKQGKLFCRRFRVLFPVFLKMVKDCKDKKSLVMGRAFLYILKSNF